MPEGALAKGLYFLCLCLGFISGVALYPLLVNFLVCSLIVLLLVFFLSLFFLKKHFVFVILGLFLIFGIFFGLCRYSFSFHEINPRQIDFYINQKISFYGVISNEPSDKGDNLESDIAVSKLENGKEMSGIVRFRSDKFPRLNYGDYILVTCRLGSPEAPDFDYKAYLERYGIYSTCFNARVKIISHNSGNPIRAWLLKLKQNIFKLTQDHVPEPEASLVLPVLFGGTDGISDDIVNQFRRVGLTHIMAVSGFNVTILAVILAYLCSLIGLRRKFVFILSTIVIISYVIMVGVSGSAVRAAVMSILLLYALTIGRLAKIINIIIITAAGTLLVNPFLLRSDIGWQLSFLALLGLIYLYPEFKTFFEKLTPKKLMIIADLLAATLAAEIATTPIILYNFGQLSVIAPVANLLVVWSIPFLTIISMAALPIAALFPIIGDYIFLPSFFVTKYILSIVSLLSAPNWASIQLHKISLLKMIVIYLILVIFVVYRKSIMPVQSKPFR